MLVQRGQNINWLPHHPLNKPWFQNKLLRQWGEKFDYVPRKLRQINSVFTRWVIYLFFFDLFSDETVRTRSRPVTHGFVAIWLSDVRAARSNFWLAGNGLEIDPGVIRLWRLEFIISRKRILISAWMTLDPAIVNNLNIQKRVEFSTRFWQLLLQSVGNWLCGFSSLF